MLCGNDGAAARDFRAHEFGGDLCGMRWGKRRKTDGTYGADATNWALPACCLFRSLRTMSFAKRSVNLSARPMFSRMAIIHLRRDDAGAGVGELRDDFAGLGAKRAAALRG